MPVVKKLIFAPFFLIVFSLLIYGFSPILKSSDFIFSLSIDTLIQLTLLSGLISLSSLLFILFSTLAAYLKIVLPIGILASLVPFIFWETGLAVVFSVGILVSLPVTFLVLENSLRSYLIFQPNSLLGPPIRHLSGLLILALCVVYFLSTNKIIAQNGFQIPDSLIDTALQFAQPPTTQPESSQLDLLKENPDLLKQAGLDPSILDNLNQPTDKTSTQTSQDVLKQTVKDQLQNLLKPYLGIIPAVLSVLLFLTLQSLVSFVGLLIYPLLWIIFYILEKSGFIKFTTEMRPVKKMVIVETHL